MKPFACPKCQREVALTGMTFAEIAREVGRHQREDQGLPATLEDAATIERLAALVAPRR